MWSCLFLFLPRIPDYYIEGTQSVNRAFIFAWIERAASWKWSFGVFGVGFLFPACTHCSSLILIFFSDYIFMLGCSHCGEIQKHQICIPRTTYENGQTLTWNDQIKCDLFCSHGQKQIRYESQKPSARVTFNCIMNVARMGLLDQHLCLLYICCTKQAWRIHLKNGFRCGLPSVEWWMAPLLFLLHNLYHTPLSLNHSTILIVLFAKKTLKIKIVFKIILWRNNAAMASLSRVTADVKLYFLNVLIL